MKTVAQNNEEKLQKVLNTAFDWWRSHRPAVFTATEHLKNPTINTATEAEEALAHAVAEYFKNE